MQATKVRLEAVAYLPGTDGSNPFSSSGESQTNVFRAHDLLVRQRIQCVNALLEKPF
jgi:hypothetical protein